MSKPYDIEHPKSELSVRERLTFLLVLFLINLLKPWKYNYEQTEFFNNIYELIGLDKKGKK